MPFVWTKNADTLDVANLENYRHQDDRRSNGRSTSIVRQIETKRYDKRFSASSAASSHGDEVSVLSLHSAFQNIPIREDAELSYPRVNSFRSTSSSVYQHSRDANEYDQDNSKKDTEFSDNSMPILQADIESIEQNWITNQQEQRQKTPSIKSPKSPNSNTSNPHKNAKLSRRCSTQTYSDKGTVYSSIYKSFCDEQSARSVASIVSHSIPKDEPINSHFFNGSSSVVSRSRGTSQAKGVLSNSYYRPSNTVGTARRCSSLSHQKSSTTLTNTSTLSSASTAQHPYEDNCLQPVPPVPYNTPTAAMTYSQNQAQGHIISTAVTTMNNGNGRMTADVNIKPPAVQAPDVKSSSPTTTSSKSSQKQSSSTIGDDTTLLMENNNQLKHGKPPLSKASSSSSITDNTSETKLQREMYRLSLELASTLSNLDYTKLEVVKYAKQVKSLESVIEGLLSEKKGLVDKLKLREKKEKMKQKQKEVVQYTESDMVTRFNKKKSNMEGIQTNTNHNPRNKQNVPRCITPSNDELIAQKNTHLASMSALTNEKSHNKDDGAPDLTFSKDEEDEEDNEINNHKNYKANNETNNESHLLFPELNESHLTCHDLYSSRVADDTLDETANEHKHSSPETLEEEDEKCYENAIDDGDCEFPNGVLESTISLIDPRDEVFNDDPFETFYNNDDSNNEIENDINNRVTKEEPSVIIDKEDQPSMIVHKKEEPSIIMDNNQSFQSWIPQFLKKDGQNRENHKDDILNKSSMTQVSRLFRFGYGANRNGSKRSLNSSVVSTRSIMTAPFKSKPGMFRFKL